MQSETVVGTRPGVRTGLRMNRRIEAFLARRLMRLPSWALRTLSRQAPVVVGGETLNPEMQFMLRSRELAGNPMRLWLGTLERSRAEICKSARQFNDHIYPELTTRDLMLSTETIALPVRVYSPADVPAEAPLLVFYHGGGFALGDLDSHDAPCRLLAAEGRLHVVSVDYRLAPEHPFPTAVEDALAAYAAIRRQPDALGLRPSRIAVGGDSAGGNLAAVVAQRMRTAPDAAPDLQLLIYPTVDRANHYPSHELFGEGFFLSREDGEMFDSLYFGEAHPRNDLRASPGLADDLAGLCPVQLVTAGFDPLRDEGEAYAERLAAAGVEVFAHREPGLLHGFINMIGVSPSARAATSRIATQLRIQLYG